MDDTGAISGLLDLDGVGWGDPADDLASMLGRVWTSGQTGGRGRDRFAAYAGEMLEVFSRRVDRGDLCMLDLVESEARGLGARPAENKLTRPRQIRAGFSVVLVDHASAYRTTHAFSDRCHR